jgi:hypothetical protein
MPWAGFEPMIPLFEQAKTFHALDHTATVIELLNLKSIKDQFHETLAIKMMKNITF